MDLAIPPSPFIRAAYQNNYTDSEPDSQSDSDWVTNIHELDSEDSDETDSLTSADSDRDEQDDLPPSRTSSFSVGSSSDAEVQAWEGFVEDSPHDLIGQATAVLDLQILANSEGDVEQQGNGESEEHRLLDQSMVSTLSASRVTPTRGSLRDLRLSFPDPLTSPRDELSRSYDDVTTTSELSFSVTASDVPTPEPSPKPTQASYSVDPVNEVLDTDLPPITPPDHKTSHLDIELYGASSDLKWDFVDRLVKKAALGGGSENVTLTHKMVDGYTRLIRMSNQTATICVSVRDRTVGSVGENRQSKARLHHPKPSLAIVYLPFTPSIPEKAEHDLYLPVILRSATNPAADDLAFEQAMWDSMHVPENQTILLDPAQHGSVFDSADLDTVNPTRLYHIFEDISTPDRKTAFKGLTDQLTSIHAMTLIALLSLVIGFTVNGAFHAASPIPSVTLPVLPHTQLGTLWSFFGPNAHNSSIPASHRGTPSSHPETSVALRPSSLKDFALAVFNPVTPAPSISVRSDELPRPTSAGDVPSSVGKAEGSLAGHIASSTTSIIARPLPAVMSVDPYGASTISPRALSRKVQENAEASTSSLSVRPSGAIQKAHQNAKLVRRVVEELVGSVPQQASELVEMFSEAVKRQSDAVEHIPQQVLEVFDMVTEAVKRQGDVVAESKVVVQEELHYRHGRAKGKAREISHELKGKAIDLYDRSGELISEFGEIFQSHVKVARSKARRIRNENTPWTKVRVDKEGVLVRSRAQERRRRRARRKRSRSGRVFSGGADL